MPRPTLDQIARAQNRMMKARWALDDALEDELDESIAKPLRDEYLDARQAYRALFDRQRQKIKVGEWIVVLIGRAFFALLRGYDRLRGRR